MSTPSEVDPFLEGQFSPLDGHAPAFDVQPDPCFDWLLEWNVGSSPVSPCATDATTALGAKNAAPEVVAPQPAAAGKKRLRENSLGSEDSCSDAVSVEQAATKKGKSDATAAAGAATGESKELDRKEKNRRSAAASRLRKKAAMETMLLRCKELESANASLSYYLGLANAEIQNLRRDLASLNTSASRGQPAEQYLDFLPLESPRQSPPKDLQDLSSVPLPCQSARPCEDRGGTHRDRQGERRKMQARARTFSRGTRASMKRLGTKGLPSKSQAQVGWKRKTGGGGGDGLPATSPSWRGQQRRAGANAAPAENVSTAGGEEDGLMRGEGALKATEGVPHPLGPSPAIRANGVTTGVNFAVVSENAKAMKLCVAFACDLTGPAVDRSSIPIREFDMARTGKTFHVCLHNIPQARREAQAAFPEGGEGVLLYCVRVEGEGGWETAHRWDPQALLLDPYAPLIYGRKRFGVKDPAEHFAERAGSMFWGTFDFDDAALADFDWGEGYRKPETAWEDTVIYEMSVRLFTSDASSDLPEEERGTFLGLRAKIPHLKALGVTCVELLPIFEYDEMEFQRIPNPRDHMVNVWGYSHVNFFAPMSRFGSNGGGAAKAAIEFKELVREMHANGIEVVLDVVYNHTAEGGDTDPYLLSFRGIDSKMYYMQDPESYEQMLNYSGCGNTVNANHPVVTTLILDSLRHWVEEYHVDGFRFDLASALCRNPRGTPLQNPPLIGAISKDPVLSKVKLISEPWDCGGLYQVGSFPNWDIWAEWNGKYRDDVRSFIKGDPGTKSAFATRIAGSADLYNYNRRKPFHSINFVIAHDGFTLNDLVSYNDKHNEANGEDSRDGSNDNLSWNCGEEGPTQRQEVLDLRSRQRKNFHLALMVSQGTPMMLMGDEYGRTTSGNNNTYGLDERMNYFRWDHLEDGGADFFDFCAGLVHYRRQTKVLGRSEFLSRRDITWHETNWGNDESCFLSFTLHGDHLGGPSVYVAFNAHEYWVENALPGPGEGKRWHRIVDTNLPSPRDFDASGAREIEGSGYRVAPHSAILLEER